MQGHYEKKFTDIVISIACLNHMKNIAFKKEKKGGFFPNKINCNDTFLEEEINTKKCGEICTAFFNRTLRYFCSKIFFFFFFILISFD